jgi:hypothetical protein
MSKLKLDPDQLTVESFDPDASGIGRRGTVRAHSDSCYDTDCQYTCANTCANTCNTCGASCGGACASRSTCLDPTCNTCFTNCGQVSCGVYICP